MHLRTNSIALSLTVIVLLSGCTASAGALAVNLAAAIETLRQQHHIAAAAYFIVSPTAVLALDSLGTPSWDSTAPFSVDDLVRIGSITKVFTALTVLRLLESRKLSLEQPVEEVLSDPPYTNPWSETHPVRVAHLLEHTAGLPDLSQKEFDFNEPVSLAEAFAVDPESRHLRWPPGRHASYSNSGAGILSKLIEEITGTDFESAVATLVFKQLGLSDARFSLTDTERDRLISGYDTDGRTLIPYWHTIYRAFGAISVPTREMIPLVQMLLNKGEHAGRRLYDKKTIERMEIPMTTLAAQSGLRYGYGLGIYQYQYQGVSFFGHGGDADGYLAFFAYSREINRGYFVVINAFNQRAMSEMRNAIQDEIITGYQPPRAARAHLTEAQIQRLTGNYGPVTRRFASARGNESIDVVAAGSDLALVHADGRRRHLYPVTPWHFRLALETVATLAFIPCGGSMYLQGDFGNFSKPLSEPTPTCPDSAMQALRTKP